MKKPFSIVLALAANVTTDNGSKDVTATHKAIVNADGTYTVKAT